MAVTRALYPAMYETRQLVYSLYFIDEVASTDTALDKNQPLGFTTLLCIVASLVVA